MFVAMKLLEPHIGMTFKRWGFPAGAAIEFKLEKEYGWKKIQVNRVNVAVVKI
jgi:hypothetical protein